MASVVRVPKNSAADYDYLAFSFGGKHSIEDFGLYRTSDGSRYNDDLSPTMQDKTAEVPGGEGMYYFGTTHKQRNFNISFAFDALTEAKYREMKKWLNGKELQDLWFAEAPYKVYTAKVTGQPNIKSVCFDVYNETTKRYERIYKGEGSITFTAYWPYAHTPDRVDYWDEDHWAEGSSGKLIGSYERFNNWEQWAENHGTYWSMPEAQVPFSFTAKIGGTLGQFNYEIIEDTTEMAITGFNIPTAEYVYVPNTMKLDGQDYTVSIKKLSGESLQTIEVAQNVIISKEAFSENKKLKKLYIGDASQDITICDMFDGTIPESLVLVTFSNIGSRTDWSNFFKDGKNLEEVVLLGDDITEKQDYNFSCIFANCPELKKLTLPFLNTHISEYFGINQSGTRKEIALTLNDKDVDSYLYNCRFLSYINLQKGLNNFYFNTEQGQQKPIFAGCKNLKEIKISNSEQYISSNNCVYSKDKETLYFVPKNVDTLDLLQSTRVIGREACYNSKIASITQNGNSNLSLTTIQEFGFANSRLSEFQSTIKEIEFGNNAFLNCTNLKTLIVHAKSFGISVLKNCTQLTSVSIGGSIERFPEAILKESLAVETLSLPFIGLNKVIEQDGIYCTECEQVLVGSIFEKSNKGMPAKDITLTGYNTNKNGQKLIPARAFYQCSLDSLVLCESTDTVFINCYAFQYCTGLKKLVVPKFNLRKQGATFEGMEALETGAPGVNIYLNLTDLPTLPYQSAIHIKRMFDNDNRVPLNKGNCKSTIIVPTMNLCQAAYWESNWCTSEIVCYPKDGRYYHLYYDYVGKGWVQEDWTDRVKENEKGAII